MLVDWMRSLLAAAYDGRSRSDSELSTDENAAAEPPLVLDVQDCHGDTQLHHAVQMALDDEEPLTEETQQGASRLIKCLRHEGVRDEHGFPISELACAQRLHNRHGLMPIHQAAARGNAPVCEALLKGGAPINARSLRRDPLVNGHFCCPPRWGKRNEQGEVTEVAMANKTALHFAVCLLREQYEADKGFAESDMALVRLLLRLGANVNAVDFHGQTPFHIAVIGSMHEVVAVLADAGADLSKGCKPFGTKNTALHLATLLNDAKMVDLLVRRGAPVDALGKDGWTPLCLAARQGMPEVTKALLAARANVFTPSGNGKTPLEIATLNSKRNTAVLALLQHEVADAVLDIAYLRRA
jgi:ankyrin repeat protein